MSGRVLLDTNVVIALFAEKLAVAEKLTETEEVFVSSIVLGELYFGARNSARVEENVGRIAVFAQSSTVLRCDSSTAERYGHIKQQLKASGTPIPENDIWISATAVQFGLTLISRDKHFGAVKGLKLERW